MNRGTLGVNSLPKIVTWQRSGCDLNLGTWAPEFNTLTTRLPSHRICKYWAMTLLFRRTWNVHHRIFPYYLPDVDSGKDFGWGIQRPPHNPPRELPLTTLSGFRILTAGVAFGRHRSCWRAWSQLCKSLNYGILYGGYAAYMRSVRFTST